MMTAHAQFDRQGRLQASDPPLARLHAGAGGVPNGEMAVPEIAAIVWQALSFSIRVSKSVIVADGVKTRKLDVDAVPVPEGIHLTVTGWEASLDLPDIAQHEDLNFDRARLVTDGAWRTDKELRITRMAAGVDRQIGFLPATARGLAFSRVFRLVPDMTGDVPVLAALAAGRSFEDQPAELLPAGAAPVLISGQPIHDHHGAFCGLQGAFRFVTRAHTEGVRDDDDELDHMVSTRLEAALRGPIGRMIDHADAIALQADGPLRRDYARYGSDIAGAARHLLGLVDDLGSVQAIERADLPIRLEPVDLVDLARRAAGLLGVRLIEKAVTLELVDPPTRPMAQGDFGRVLQILVNLIGNATRYAPENGTIYVSIEPGPERVCVAVRDQGKGIAPEDQARIFEKFERLDPSEPGGSGLGLYISRRLAQAMGGDLQVHSAVGEGACFTLCLPALPDDVLT